MIRTFLTRLSWLNFGLFLVLSLSSCTALARMHPTPVVAGLVTPDEIPYQALLTPSPEPFHFNLPTPGAEPVSGWRPPLYPLPWAMSPYDHFYFARPIAADQVNWPLPDYRYGGIFFAPNIVHTGVDIDAPAGTPVLAAGDGTVIWADWGLFTEAPGNKADPYGMAVAIRHDFGYNGQQLYTIYGHMSKILAVAGQDVRTGDVLGLVGATGATTGPHVHFEVRFPDNSFYDTYNPELWIAPPQGWGVLVGRVTDTKGKTLQQLEVYVSSAERKNVRMVKTYGGGSVNHDPYYDENLVLGDLPAGLYKVTLNFDKNNRQTWVNIYPGQVTFFTFEGDNGFDVAHPPPPTLDFVPAPASSASTPNPSISR
jgi:murein DD-endopeptidase MepM/ murein hydrolase activator NlpD